MKILLVGALSWNPERIRSLHERGHALWGLWSRSMAWDQGPYPSLEGSVRQVALHDAARTIREEGIECVYGLLQAYDSRHWGPPAPGVEHGVWKLLRTLLLERRRGAFDAPFVWHSGFDVQNLDLDVARALDAHLVCNREKLTYWTTPVAEGGCGLDLLEDCGVVEFLDSDRPKLEFMNDRFAERLSDADGELHTVCVGRPFGIDYLAAARRGIHVHVYPNSFDDVYRTLATGLSRRTCAGTPGCCAGISMSIPLSRRRARAGPQFAGRSPAGSRSSPAMTRAGRTSGTRSGARRSTIAPASPIG